MNLADILTYSIVIGGVLAMIYIGWSYARGLKESPRDMWFLFLYKFIEYSAYGAINMVIVLWLQRDCGLSDVVAGEYIAVWSMALSVMAMIAGALVDTIGIKKTLFISILFLLISRFFSAFITNPVLVAILGFIPLTIGFAIVGPLVSVAIKRYTTKEGAALGFGLFYVIMNLAYAVGGVAFDWFRNTFVARDAAGKIINENFGATIFGMHFSTYQLMFVFGFGATIISLLAILLIRDGVAVKNGKVVVEPLPDRGSGMNAIKSAAKDTGTLIYNVAREKYFWIFIGMIALTIPVRTIFYHFHYTFPAYGIRVLGEGAKIGNIYGVLNPVLIIFLVPLVASFTKKISSYKMMVIGSIVSSLSCFIVLIPTEAFSSWTNSVLGELVFLRWLGMAETMTELAANPPVPEYWPLIVFITIFTVGEAIWSPRLMQFTAEVAPKGKEGSYIALSVLPYFAAKMIVGPMSGFLQKIYTPKDAAGNVLPAPEHYMVWFWIGAVAVLTPIGLLLFKRVFDHTQERKEEMDRETDEAIARARAAEAAKAEGENQEG